MAGVPVADDAAHCAQLLRQTDRRRFLAALFAPAAHRPALLALYAANGEIARVREVAHEPLPGELRLQWWREVLGGGRAEEARAHPVAAALLDTRDRYRLPPQPLLDLVDAHAFDLYDEPFATSAELEEYLRRTSSAIFQLAAQILAPISALDAAQFSFHAGIAYGMTDLLRALPRHASRRQMYIPLEVLRDRHASREDVFAGQATAELRAALGDMRAQAHKHLAAARQALQAAPSAVLPAFLPLAVVKPQLRHMERREDDPFEPRDLPAWRQQWILWRASRRGPAMLA